MVPARTSSLRSAMWPVVVLVALAAIASIGFLWSGLYDIGADDPHTTPVRAALEMLRERSVAARSANVRVPDLRDPALIRQGAGNYQAMCSGCHLSPGQAPTELSRGLYPSPPDFTKGRFASPAQQFWIVKHGIKASGMPAWGKSMQDRYLWGLVAFVRQLPRLDAAGYQALVAGSPGHSHGGQESRPPGENMRGPVAPATADAMPHHEEHHDGHEHHD